MDISDAGILSKTLEAANLQVFTDGHDLFGHDLGDGQILAGILAAHESVNIGRSVFRDDGGDILDERNEQLALGAEVSLTVDLDDNADTVFDGGVSHALGGDAAGLLRSLRQTLLTQPLNCLIHIAVGLDERLLAVHHADIGHFAQSLYISSSKCHN